MLIKSLIKREGGSDIEFGDPDGPKTIIKFRPKEPNGDHVAEVTDKKIIQKLLAITEGYEIADDEPVKPKKAKDEAKDPVELIGKSWEPALIEYGAEGKSVDTAGLVQFVFDGSGLTPEDWNALPKEVIEKQLAENIEAYAATLEAGTPEETKEADEPVKPKKAKSE